MGVREVFYVLKRALMDSITRDALVYYTYIDVSCGKFLWYETRKHTFLYKVQSNVVTRLVAVQRRDRGSMSAQGENTLSSVPAVEPLHPPIQWVQRSMRQADSHISLMSRPRKSSALPPPYAFTAYTGKTTDCTSENCVYDYNMFRKIYLKWYQRVLISP